nr:putative ribonuclease H-like domain-containing protein [Tanacetum cinerariifolium]
YRALWVPTVNRSFPPVNRKFSTGSRKFPTANRKFPTASRKFPTGSIKCSTADMEMKRKAVKPSACWFWKPSQNLSYKGKLEFENVFFVKDLKYNLFSVSQIYDNKNIVMFTDSGCIVLGRDFKLLDDANILLRTPRQHNMYSIDLNNIVPHTDLTCLVAKAFAKECILWHRRLVTVETPIPTTSSPVPTAYSTDSQEPSSDARVISKRVANQEETPSLENILSLTNRFEDILGVTTNSDGSNGVEADISNMEIAITASPTPTLRIHKDHLKSQIIGPVDTIIQTRNKSKELEE